MHRKKKSVLLFVDVACFSPLSKSLCIYLRPCRRSEPPQQQQPPPRRKRCDAVVSVLWGLFFCTIFCSAGRRSKTCPSLILSSTAQYKTFKSNAHDGDRLHCWTANGAAAPTQQSEEDPFSFRRILNAMKFKSLLLLPTHRSEHTLIL